MVEGIASLLCNFRHTHNKTIWHLVQMDRVILMSTRMVDTIYFILLIISYYGITKQWKYFAPEQKSFKRRSWTHLIGMF